MKIMKFFYELNKIGITSKNVIFYDIFGYGVWVGG